MLISPSLSPESSASSRVEGVTMSTLTESTAWKALEKHRQTIDELPMRDLFRDDPDRFRNFSVQFNGTLLDYSKNRITNETLPLLFDLAHQAGLEQWIEKMFSGDRINSTENRAVLHIALRNRSNRPILVDGQDVKIGRASCRERV